MAQCWQIQRHHSTNALKVLRRPGLAPGFLQIEAMAFNL
jgi:hypothetical protein